MDRIAPFAVEQWMDEHETQCKYNLGETCWASVSVRELVGLSEDPAASAEQLFDADAVQDYGEVRGSSEVRGHLSRLYSSKTETALPADHILITTGAIAANMLALWALVGPGDHVICHYPTYQQLYSVPATLGASVSLWRADPGKEWQPDLDELKALVRPETRLVVVNNPQNPTGAVLRAPLLRELAAFCEERGLTLMADEVYRPLFHGINPTERDFPPSLLSLGHRETLVTGSLSKAYSLAGLRVGWVASRSPTLVARLVAARHYTTIAVSRMDQAVAAFALAPHTIHALLARNLALARANLALLERFVVKHDEFCSWTRPVAGTTAFIKFERDGKPVDAERLCRDILAKTGVLLLPGDPGFGPEFRGYVRFGYVNRTDIVRDALEELRKFMRKEYDDVPLCD